MSVGATCVFVCGVMFLCIVGLMYYAHMNKNAEGPLQSTVINKAIDDLPVAITETSTSVLSGNDTPHGQPIDSDVTLD